MNSSFQDTTSASPLSALLQGVICLIHKKGQPLFELLGYRPITLLDCDVKLVMQIIANRLDRPLDYVIDLTSTAFLSDRSISSNNLYNLGIVSRIRELGFPAWSLDSDLVKAYDSTSRELSLNCFTKLGFVAGGVVRWLRILMAGSESAVRINGFISPFFPASDGFPQGAVTSCHLSIATYSLFTSHLNTLRLNGRISSILLPPPPSSPSSSLHPFLPTVLLPPPPPP